ncbi:MarR family winged helix-turn-helix transcriptional regulator [Paenibacillus puldeungensis]|uniref:MarR family winged helix-turn-helix transcriptional regulator n=1 Tax=Paenibacillus puldeungensis TaxID=696536 RepID=UPI0036D41569
MVSTNSEGLLVEKGPTWTKTSMLFTHLVHQIRRQERQPRSLGKVGSFTPSEIHTIRTIGTGDGIIMGQLADRLGVTNGAITQLVERMENKGLVKRAQLMRGSRKVNVTLTDKGQSAYYAYEQFYVKPFEEWIRDELSEKEFRSFEKGLNKLIEFLSV